MYRYILVPLGRMTNLKRWHSSKTNFQRSPLFWTYSFSFFWCQPLLSLQKPLSPRSWHCSFKFWIFSIHKGSSLCSVATLSMVIGWTSKQDNILELRLESASGRNCTPQESSVSKIFHSSIIAGNFYCCFWLKAPTTLFSFLKVYSIPKSFDVKNFNHLYCLTLTSFWENEYLNDLW